MPTAANGNNLLIGRGKWYVDRHDVNDNRTGYVFLGEADNSEITPSVTNKERYTTTRAANNKIASVPTQQKHTLAISAYEFTPANVALALLGTTSVFSQTAGLVTGEVLSSVVSTKQGRVFKTAGRMISAPAVHATISGSPVTLVQGTDFDIEDATSGTLHVISTAADTATLVTTDYTKAAITALPQVATGNSRVIIASLLFVGDPTSGPGFDCEIWRAQISPSGAVGFLSDDFTAMPLNMEILDDSLEHSDAPYYRLTYKTNSF